MLMTRPSAAVDGLAVGSDAVHLVRGGTSTPLPHDELSLSPSPLVLRLSAPAPPSRVSTPPLPTRRSEPPSPVSLLDPELPYNWSLVARAFEVLDVRANRVVLSVLTARAAPDVGD